MDPFEVIDSQEKLPSVRRARDGFNRGDVINAFQEAFQVMGGTTRLALWANANPDKFFPLYAKLLPSTSYQFTEGTVRQIHHALPPSALDMHPGFDPHSIVPVPEQEEVPRE